MGFRVRDKRAARVQCDAVDSDRFIHQRYSYGPEGWSTGCRRWRRTSGTHINNTRHLAEGRFGRTQDRSNSVNASTFRIQSKRFELNFSHFNNKLQISERRHWKNFRIWLNLGMVNWLCSCFEFLLLNPAITYWNQSYIDGNRTLSFTLDSNAFGFFVEITEEFLDGYSTLMVPEDLSRFGFRFFLAQLKKAEVWFRGNKVHGSAVIPRPVGLQSTPTVDMPAVLNCNTKGGIQAEEATITSDVIHDYSNQNGDATVKEKLVQHHIAEGSTLNAKAINSIVSAVSTGAIGKFPSVSASAQAMNLSEQETFAPLESSKQDSSIDQAVCSNYASAIQEPHRHNPPGALNVNALPFQPSIPISKHLHQGKPLHLKEMSMDSEAKTSSGGLQQGKSLKELKALATNKEAVPTKVNTSKPLGLLDLDLIYDRSLQISLIDMPLLTDGKEHRSYEEGGHEVSQSVTNRAEVTVEEEQDMEAFHTLEIERQLDDANNFDDFNPKGVKKGKKKKKKKY